MQMPFGKHEGRETITERVLDALVLLQGTHELSGWLVRHHSGIGDQRAFRRSVSAFV